MLGVASSCLVFDGVELRAEVTLSGTVARPIDPDTIVADPLPSKALL